MRVEEEVGDALCSAAEARPQEPEWLAAAPGLSLSRPVPARLSRLTLDWSRDVGSPPTDRLQLTGRRKEESCRALPRRVLAGQRAPL